jgi:uncharacterized protein YoxC
MEMEQMMARLSAEIRTKGEKMKEDVRTNQAKVDAILKEIKEI